MSRSRWSRTGSEGRRGRDGRDRRARALAELRAAGIVSDRPSTRPARLLRSGSAPAAQPQRDRAEDQHEREALAIQPTRQLAGS